MEGMAVVAALALAPLPIVELEKLCDRRRRKKMKKICLSFFTYRALRWLFEFCIIEETKEKGGFPS